MAPCPKTTFADLKKGDAFEFVTNAFMVKGPWLKSSDKTFTAPNWPRLPIRKVFYGEKSIVQKVPNPYYGPVAKTPEAREDFAIVERDTVAVVAGRGVGDLHTPRAVYDFCAPTLAKYSQEVFLTIPLDLRGVPLNDKPYMVAMGQTDAVAVEVSDACKPCADAHGVVFVHNHPTGKAKPSRADKDLTRRLKEALKTSYPKCAFLDHVIVGGASKEYYSFADEKIYSA